MTSHQGPPLPPSGPPQLLSLFSTAIPSLESHPEKHPAVPYSHVSEPSPKRQRIDGSPPRYQAETNEDALKNPNLESDGHEYNREAQDLNLPLGKQPFLYPASRQHKNWVDEDVHESSDLAIERAAMRRDVPTKPYVAEPPKSIPRYQKFESPQGDDSEYAVRLEPGTQPADFFPWSGHHPEDILDEVTSRNGFYDKMVAPFYNEFLSARPTLLQGFQDTSSCQSLSSFFSSALKQRERHGTITAASTFKPPPRVTLTDTKRESWMRDLANSAIPLRRLSRTIPHGIRGKLLLDHCLMKDIPLPRAIWLVKCVGANEIRACKRKGKNAPLAVGGEAKWIEDWTKNVETFLEAMIDDCGNEHWKARMGYSLRLVSFIYAERLLDHAEYFRWLIERLSTCNLENLPIWLLVLEISKQDLLRYRHHGIALVNTLLAHLGHVQKIAYKETYEEMFQVLQKEFRNLLVDSPDCFLWPQSWKSHKQLLQNYVVLEDDFLRSHFRDLELRNQQFEHSENERYTLIPNLHQQKIINALDSLVDIPNYPKVALICFEAACNIDELVKICLLWAISTYRCGQYRIYAAARLLRIWTQYPMDLQKIILDYLSRRERSPNIEWSNFYRICAELVYSGHFSVGKYCQWLMARGTLENNREKSSVMTVEAQLLRELPLRCLPDHVVNLRRSLLAMVDTNVVQEAAIINIVQSRIATQLPAIFSQKNATHDDQFDDVHVYALSRTQKSAIAWWMQRSISCHLQTWKKQDRKSEQRLYSFVSDQDFRLLRRIFECLQEYVAFVKILCSLAVTEKSSTLLTTITDTVNYHFDIFNALGTAKQMFRLLFNQRKFISSQENYPTSLTDSLFDLGIRLPDLGPEISTLRKEASSGHKQSLAAPSPISDNMVEAVHLDKATFFEEMDQMLLAGTSMDHTTLARCFESITDHFEKSWAEGTAFSHRCSELLFRLRSFDVQAFGGLATPWLKYLILHTARPRLGLVLMPLICYDICPLGTMIEHVTQLSSNGAQGKSAAIALELLELLSTHQSESMPLDENKTHRFLQRRRHALESHLESTVSLIHCCMKAIEIRDGLVSSSALELFSRDSVKTFIRSLVSEMSITGILLTQHSPPFRQELRDVLNLVWFQGSTTVTIHYQLSYLLDDVSAFNRPFSQLYLEEIIHSTPNTGHNAVDDILEILLGKVTSASPPQIALWSNLLSGLDADSASHIHEGLVTVIMTEFSKYQNTFPDVLKWKVQCLLDIAEATSFDLPAATTITLIRNIIGKTTELINLFVNTKELHLEPERGNDITIIHTLIRVISIHQSNIRRPQFPQKDLAQICLFLASLYRYSVDAAHPSLAKQILDVLALMSDAMSQDTRSYCTQMLSRSRGTQDPRLEFIFGDSTSLLVDEWLSLFSGAGSLPKAFKGQIPSLYRWEMIQDASPLATENDTSLSLTLFAARKSVL